MNKAIPIICVALLIAIMVGVNKFGWWLSTKLSSDFPFGFLVGVFLTLGIVYLIQKFEQSSSRR